MKKELFLLSALSVMVFACDRPEQQPKTFSLNEESTGDEYAPDNTGKNARDTYGNSKTPTSQSEGVEDRTITQKVRKALMDDDNLSINAKNIKIITIDGIVTLRGPINTQQEKTQIEKKIKQIQGVRRIENRLEVSNSNY